MSKADKRRGFCLWFTGLSGAGKSTVSGAVHRALVARGLTNVEILDGDEVRTHLTKGLGFTREDRDTNVLRIAWVCHLLVKHGVPCMTAAISPYRATRAQARAMVERVGGPGSFIEVFVHAPLEVCAQRDVKGLYARAKRGEIPHFTGISDPYEPPERPEIELRTDRETVDESAGKVLAYLEAQGWIPPAEV